MDNISNLSSACNITNALGSINEKFIIQQWALIYNIYVMPLRSIKSEGIILKEKNIFQVITNIILSTIHYCKDLGALPQTPQNFNRSELCFAKRLCRRIMVSILLRKTVCDRPVFFGVHTLRFIVLIQTSDKPHLKNVALFYILKRFIVLYRIL